MLLQRGYRACATDMSGWRKGTQSAAAGATTPVMLALMHQDSFRSGGFYRDGQQRSFVDGVVLNELVG